MLVGGILSQQTIERSLALCQVVELVLEDDARMKQSFLNLLVTGFKLFVSEGYLCQIVLTIMWVVGKRIVSGILLLASDGIVGNSTVSRR